MNTTTLVSLIFFGLTMTVHGYPGIDDKENKPAEPATVINWEWVHKLTNRYKEDIEKVEIKIHFHGHKFRAENVDVQVINNDILFVKAEEYEEKFEQKFKLPAWYPDPHFSVEKIQYKFDINKNKTQTLVINISKDIKRIQVPVFMEVDETNEENKTWISSRPHCNSCHSFREDMEKVEIKIQYLGSKFKPENLDVQVINDDVLFVKAEDGEEKIEDLIKLPSNVLVNKIQSKFVIIDEKTQTLFIIFPKDINVSTHQKYIISSSDNDCISFLPIKILSSYLCLVYCNCELQMPGNRATCCYRKGK